MIESALDAVAGIFGALSFTAITFALLDWLDLALLRDDVQHLRREAGEGFYDIWPEDPSWR